MQIGDENVHLVRQLLDEVFGPSNFIAAIQFKKTAASTGSYLSPVADYSIWYGRNAAITKYRGLKQERDLLGAGGGYEQEEYDVGIWRKLPERDLQNV